MTAPALEVIARRPGRPSKTDVFRPVVLGLLAKEPSVSAKEVLERLGALGYNGRKSAAYGLVAQLRAEHRLPLPGEVRREARARDREERLQRRAAQQAERELWKAQERERIRHWREDRERRRQDRRPGEFYRPFAIDEESNRLRVLARKWLESRRATHKTCGDDRSRWRTHLAPVFGDLEPNEVDATRIREFILAKLDGGLTSTTVRNCVAVLSSLFTDLVEQGLAARNPARSLPRALKRLVRRAHDPRTTPFLERMQDIQRLRSLLSGLLRTMFSVGVMSGLRPSELVPLDWRDIRSDMRLMHVQRRFRNGTLTTPKSGKGRTVPISAGLRAELKEWRDLTGGTGLVFKPKGRARFIEMKLFRDEWRSALKLAGIAPLRFYDATRHTFASQWVMAGQPVEKLSAILGHSSIEITMRNYVHLKPESMTIPDVIDFGPPRATDPMGEV